MTNDVQIRQFQVADREALLSFLRLAYADDPRKSEPGFWAWHYLENPNSASDNIPLWVIESDGQIVGQLATIPVIIKAGQRKMPAIWILDFIVHADHRGKGLGKRLVLEAQKSYPTMITLGINEQSEAVFRSLKWAAVGGVYRYQRLLFPGNAIKWAPVGKIVNLLYAPFRRRLKAISPGKNSFVRPVTVLDASFEALWHRVNSQWTCAVVRDPASLKWQFIDQPGKKFEILGAYDGDELVGYVVLFIRKPERGNVPPKAAITDLVYDAASSLNVIDGLLTAAISLAVERRAGSLVTDMLDKHIEDRLKHFGFWRIKRSPQFMASTAENADLIYDADNWFLTRADSDVSIFEEPNL